jgi:hypothetical protein
LITVEEMMTEAELFRSVYPELIREIDRVESTRGKLNDFQLMQAVAHAKTGLGVLSYERRQTINAIFDTFVNIYRKNGRTSAEKWAGESFGCISIVAAEAGEDTSELVSRIRELTRLIEQHESDLLQLYRELYMLERYWESKQQG